MEKIVDFNNKLEFMLYRKRKAHEEIGSGAEGTCFLSNDGYVYKDFTEGFEVVDYETRDILTTSDVKSDVFIFPDVLFTVRGSLVGLRYDYVETNLVDRYLMDDEYLANFDFDKFLEAYKKMIPEVDKLSDQGVKIFDLTANLLYDGERFYGIDTCGYTKTTKDVHDFNRSCLDGAVKNIFYLMDEYYYDNDHISLDLGVEEYVREIEKRYKGNQDTGPYVYY